MKAYMITGMAIATTIAFSYVFMMDANKTDQSLKHSRLVEDAFVTSIEEKVDRLSDNVQQHFQKHKDMIEQFRSEQMRLNIAVATLEERLQVEKSKGALHNEQATEFSYSGQDGSSKTVDSMIEDYETEMIGESELSQWMDDTINSGYLDDMATTLAAEQVEAGIVNLPELKLVDLLCSQRFCRASFMNNNGGMPDVSKILGTPPFMNEGFTINEPDGTVTVYFTDIGISLSELQDEVRLEKNNYN